MVRHTLTTDGGFRRVRPLPAAGAAPAFLARRPSAITVTLTLLLAFTNARALPAESPDADAAAIRVTSSAGDVSGCASLGEAAVVGEDGIAILRAEAFRRGADTIRLISFSGRDARGGLYRCTPAKAAERSARPAPVPAVPAPTPDVSPSLPPRVTTPPPPSASPASGKTPAADARRSSTDRQRRAREELEDLKAALRVTSDPALLRGCEKRGEGRAPIEGGEDVLRGNAVGELANVLLVRKTDVELRGEYFRCASVQLEAIPRQTGGPSR